MGRERVGFRDDGDQVDARSEPLHDLDIERLEPAFEVSSGSREERSREDVRVSSGADEVEARVYTHVELLSTLRLLLLTHEGLVLVVLHRVSWEERGEGAGSAR